jgi:formylglycine-generating enzyme required for sulfatase activity
MAERSGLLYAHEEGYSFGDHLTVQEFLAANYLVDNLRGTGEWVAFLQAHAGQSWWREVFLLMAGYLLQWPQQLQRFLLKELGDLPGEGDARAYGLAWAGRALLEIPPRRVGWHAGARDELARRLVRVLWQNPPATSVAARVEAGDLLGRLGDPRFTGPYLLPEFIAIPAGRFRMGSAKDEQDARENEMPRHQVELDSYALARYSATNAMFRCFTEAGGYGDGRWWSEARSAGRWTDGEGFDRGDQPRYWDDVRFNGPNQPVVGVSWYEAVAYCRWLTAALDDGFTYRLPTEAEWERAARGPGGRRYPWGDPWQAGRANTKELNLERTTPVGIFPDGASAEGLLDLAGNVYEWCSDWYAGDTYRLRAGAVARNPGGAESGDYKILRGGWWGSSPSAVRCAIRDFISPDLWYDDVGFRVARGPRL